MLSNRLRLLRYSYPIDLIYTLADWINVNKILGARRDVDIPGEGSEGERVNAGSRLPVQNTLNARGRRILCQFLTNEIRIYIDLLNRAVNLSDDDVRAALEGTQANCPSVVKYLGGEAGNGPHVM
mmetsp:Transcript_3247/g.5225  ORF Transcript_3247/g.5225 Transcript_3247/m.5225 type:complete len:125 (-) Transcript_3247:638-1012(-)